MLPVCWKVKFFRQCRYFGLKSDSPKRSATCNVSEWKKLFNHCIERWDIKIWNSVDENVPLWQLSNIFALTKKLPVKKKAVFYRFLPRPHEFFSCGLLLVLVGPLPACLFQIFFCGELLWNDWNTLCTILYRYRSVIGRSETTNASIAKLMRSMLPPSRLTKLRKHKKNDRKLKTNQHRQCRPH